MTSDKIRSIVLAVVMVMSVVAIAPGAASAQVATTDVVLSQSSSSGSSVTYDVQIDNSNGGVGTFNGLNVAINDTNVAEITSISAAHGGGTASSSVASDGSSASVDGGLGGDTADSGSATFAQVTIQTKSAGDASLDVTSVSTISDEAGSGSYSVANLGSELVQVSGSNQLQDVPLPAQGAAAEPHRTFPNYDSNADGLVGSAIWTGQVIEVTGSALSEGDTVQIRERIDADTTQLRSQVSADAGSVTIDTEDLEGGNYYLYAGNTAGFGAPTVSAGQSSDAVFSVTEPSLSASFGIDTATDEGPNSDDTDFEFDSNRANYPVNVTTESGDLSAQDLANIFTRFDDDLTVVDHNANDDDDEISIKQTSGGQIYENGVVDADDYTVDFTGIDEGTYNFVFSGTDSVAEDTDTVEVTDSNQDAEFDRGVERQAAGDIAEFNISLEDTGDAFVQIGGEDSNFVEVLYLEEDDDALMNVQINTRLLGSSADRQAVYDTDNVDTLISANHPGANSGDTLGDVLSSGDLGGITQSGDLNDGVNDANEIALFEDDGQAVNNDFDDYVDNIGIADNAASQLTRPPQPTDYRIAVGGTNNVDDAVFDADPGGEANNQLGSMTLELTQPEITGVTTHTAPEETADDETDVDELVSLATPREEIAVEDRLVVQFEATGIFGALVANSSGDADESDFDRLTDDGVPTQVLNEYLNGNGADEQTTVEVVAEEDIGNQDALEVDLTASDSETYLVLDQANDQFFLIADTSSDDAFANGDAPSSDEDFTATIEYDADEGDDRYEFGTSAPRSSHPAPFANTGSSDNFPYLAQGDVISGSADLTLAPRSIEFDNTNEDDQIEAPASENSEISATTNVAPGSDAELRITSTDASSSFRQGNDVNITEDGSITTSFDLSGQEVGDAFDTNFRVEGSAVDSVDSVVVESVGDTDDGEETNETDTDDGETEPADDGETNETTDDGESESTDDGTPGFGAVVALIALIGAALLAVRRQD